MQQKCTEASITVVFLVTIINIEMITFCHTFINNSFYFSKRVNMIIMTIETRSCFSSFNNMTNSACICLFMLNCQIHYFTTSPHYYLYQIINHIYMNPCIGPWQSSSSYIILTLCKDKQKPDNYSIIHTLVSNIHSRCSCL